MVELVAIEIEASDQRPDRAIDRAGGDESCLDLRQLDDLPALLGFLHTDHRAAPYALVRRRLVVQHARGKFKTVLAYLEHLAAAQIGAYQLGAGLEDDGRQQVVAVVILCLLYTSRCV